jgi:CRP/FNR family transcriptional regulator
MPTVKDTPSVHDLVELLGRVKHFQDLSSADRATIIRAGRLCTFPAGTVIYREGEPVAGMFVLLTGCVHIVKFGLQGQQAIVAEIKPIIMFNEVAVLDGGANPATAIAVQDCVTWHIGYEAFQTLLQRYPALSLALLRLLAARMRMLLGHYEDLTSRSVIARTAKLLLDLSARGTQSIQRHHYTNPILAARIATVPEAFSRALQWLRHQRAITCTRTTIIVNDVNLLEELAQGGRNALTKRKTKAK